MIARRPVTLAIVLTAIVAVIYAMRLDDVAGLIVDDAWYILLAKAIAGGDGYRLISSATIPVMPSVPPGFPAMLAAVFLVAPTFPDNLALLKVISMLAMAGVGVCCWIDFHDHRGVPSEQGLLLAAVVVLTPALVFLATSTAMAECVFTLAVLLAVLASERVIRQPPAQLGAAVLAGVVLAAAVLIRTAGVAAIAAVIVFLAVHRRWRQLAVCAVTAGVCVLPWQLYAAANAPTPAESFAHGGTIAYPYGQLLQMARPGDVSVTMTPVEIAVRSVRNVAGIATRDVGAVVMPSIFRGAHESGQEVVSVGPPGRGSMGGATGTMVVSVLISLVIVAGAVRSRAWLSLPALLIAASVVMIAAVGAETYRYVLPLTPFLVVFFWRGLSHPGAARIAVMCLLGFHLIDHAMYIRAKAAGTADWIADAQDVDAVFDTLRRQPPGAVASTNPGLVYLRTGRKGVALAYAEQNWDIWTAAGVRYLVALRPLERPTPGQGEWVLQTKRRRWIVRM
jgi:hypothetical protein